MPRLFATVLLAFACSAAASAQPTKNPSPPPLDWKSLEAPLLSNHTQLTRRADFVRAGEAYFSPHGEWIIFQAVPVPEEGAEPDPFYAMYVARLKQGAPGRATGIDDLERVSNPDTANTCGWFDRVQPGRILFGSTLVRPADEQKSGFQVGSRKYVWMFPQEMEIVTRMAPKMTIKLDQREPNVSMIAKFPGASPVFTRPNYDAECSYSSDGRFILYAHVEDDMVQGRPDANIYIYDTTTQKHHPIVIAPGYDGGPFFSPDGKTICYRSDRKGDDLLQIFVADLKFEDGVPVGIEKEYQLTDNEHVNWAPYWHPSGTYLVYGSSEVGHHNYEIFAAEADMSALRRGDKVGNQMRRARITHADGADVLPVFSNDGEFLMWTSQRGPKIEGETRASSQLWIAEVTGSPFEPAR